MSWWHVAASSGSSEQEVGEMSEGETQTVETTETRTVETTEAVTSPTATSPAGSGEDLTKVRDLVIKANPDVVPDLIRGSSVDELIASVEPARTAYQRVADQVRAGASTTEAAAAATAATASTAAEQPPRVPAGGGSNVVDPGDLKPTTKIARALADRRRK